MKFLKNCMMIVTGIIIVYVLVVFYQLSTTRVRDTKDYSQIYVEENDVFDYKMMLNPPEKYSALNQIDTPMRQKVAKYMKENNYKLQCGKQIFIRIDPTFKELVDDCFVFVGKKET
ncbi:MAG: hypothetical protein IKA17_11265 [Clostridia bacterium]|nr:hypothetical protein [Clostridia bacterium]